MLYHGVPEEVTDKVISTALSMGLEQPQIALMAAMENIFKFKSLPMKAHPKPLLLVGPPGAGKTLAAAKMAARASMNGLTPCMISTDTVRAGGVEQLEAFTRILGIDLKKAKKPADLKALIDDAGLMQKGGCDQIIIDTGGLNPFDRDEMRLLAKYAAAAQMDPILVMPAGIDADDSAEIARVYAALGTKWMIPMRLDIARRFGGLLSAADKAGMAFADSSDTPQVAEGLRPMSAKTLSNLLMIYSPGMGQHANNKRSNKG